MPKEQKRGVNPLSAVQPLTKEETAAAFAPDTTEESQDQHTASTPPKALQSAEVQTAPAPQAAPSEDWVPLYQTPPSDVWLDKSFQDRYAKGGAVFDPYLVGAIETIAKVEDRKMYKLWQEMMRDFILKHEQSLQSAEAQKLLKKKERPYREKYHEKE